MIEKFPDPDQAYLERKGKVAWIADTQSWCAPQRCLGAAWVLAAVSCTQSVKAGCQIQLFPHGVGVDACASCSSPLCAVLACEGNAMLMLWLDVPVTASLPLKKLSYPSACILHSTFHPCIRDTVIWCRPMAATR